MFREAADFVFAVDEIVVFADIEYSAPTFDEFGGDAAFFFNGGRQTGGGGSIVSLDTEFDGEVHGSIILQYAFYFNSNLRQVIFDNFPDGIFIDTEILVNKDVSHTTDFPPGYGIALFF